MKAIVYNSDAGGDEQHLYTYNNIFDISMCGYGLSFKSKLNDMILNHIIAINSSSVVLRTFIELPTGLRLSADSYNIVKCDLKEG
jgi:hypothetical protein